MKCPHCNGEHPEDIKVCPETGKSVCHTKATEPGTSQIVVYCKDEGVHIQIGHPIEVIGLLLIRNRITLHKGENILRVSEYPDLKYGFSFIQDDNSEKIIEIDLSDYDSSAVDDMSMMFYGCSSLESVRIKSDVKRLKVLLKKLPTVRIM